MKIWFLGSSDGLALLRVKALILYLEKVFICLGLEGFSQCSTRVVGD